MLILNQSIGQVHHNDWGPPLLSFVDAFFFGMGDRWSACQAFCGLSYHIVVLASMQSKAERLKAVDHFHLGWGSSTRVDPESM